MITIWKFEIQITAEQIVQMPIGAEIICCQIQGSPEGPCLWAIVCDENPTQSREILTYGTGRPIDTNENRLIYIGTYQLHGLVFHVFER